MTQANGRERPTAADNQLVIYADGGISPQRAGVGVVVQNERGHVVLVTNRSLGKMTSNEAEYHGLILAFEAAERLRAQHIEVRLDSEVVVYQMVGKFAVRSSALKPLHRQACALARKFSRVVYTHVPRKQNLVANALAGEAVAGRRWHGQGIS